MAAGRLKMREGCNVKEKHKSQPLQVRDGAVVCGRKEAQELGPRSLFIADRCRLAHRRDFPTFVRHRFGEMLSVDLHAEARPAQLPTISASRPHLLPARPGLHYVAEPRYMETRKGSNRKVYRTAIALQSCDIEIWDESSTLLHFRSGT